MPRSSFALGILAAASRTPSPSYTPTATEYRRVKRGWHGKLRRVLNTSPAANIRGIPPAHCSYPRRQTRGWSALTNARIHCTAAYRLHDTPSAGSERCCARRPRGGGGMPHRSRSTSFPDGGKAFSAAAGAT